MYMKKDWIIVIVVFYISCEIMCCLCNAKKCLRMFKSVSILIFDQHFMNGRYFQHPRGILDAIISVTEGLNSLGTLYIARFHKYAPLLRDPKMIPSCSRRLILYQIHALQYRERVTTSNMKYFLYLSTTTPTSHSFHFQGIIYPWNRNEMELITNLSN